jgi:hypothetical protein
MKPNIEQQVNEVWDIAVFLQMMAAFCDDIDFNELSKLMISFHNLIKESDDDKITKELPRIEKKIRTMEELIKIKYPLKRDYRDITRDWNEKHKVNKELFSDGIMLGWLEEQIDLKNYYHYDYTPYHFKIGLVIHKGRGEIEENFLLQDSFSCLVKAERLLNLLENYSNRQKEQFKSVGKSEFDKKTLDSITALKYEISFYSRMTIISFYSFLECFVNSIGFDYYYRNKDKQYLSDDEIEILQGTRDNRFLSLKNKIERFQKILRADKTAIIILSDENQIKEPFKTLFDNYEKLRNASVHYSPSKSRIWMKPHDWINEASVFARLVINSANEIWKSCHETNKGPDYLGRLEFRRLYKMAESKEILVNEIKNDN